jgi:hypothetical protein
MDETKKGVSPFLKYVTTRKGKKYVLANEIGPPDPLQQILLLFGESKKGVTPQEVQQTLKDSIQELADWIKQKAADEEGIQMIQGTLGCHSNAAAHIEEFIQAAIKRGMLRIILPKTRYSLSE